MDYKEFLVLSTLEAAEKHSLTQRELAEKTKMSVGTVNGVVSSASDEGWIANGTLTEAGLAALEPYRVKRAVFIAAGFGSRLVPITLNTPKPLVRVHGKRIIDSMPSLPLASRRSTSSAATTGSSSTSFSTSTPQSSSLRTPCTTKPTTSQASWRRAICCPMRTSSSPISSYPIPASSRSTSTAPTTWAFPWSAPTTGASRLRRTSSRRSWLAARAACGRWSASLTGRKRMAISW